MLDPTLLGLLTQIENDQIVLPAMQRPFVWKEDRIYRLIDSLLREFPIGATMLWRTQSIQRYRRISRDIDSNVSQLYTYESSEAGANRYLVLDGQQRLTSLYVAFKGSYNHKQLYIDVLSGDSIDKDPGNEYYDCRFLSTKEADDRNTNFENGKCHFMPISTLRKINPVNAAKSAHKTAIKLNLNDDDTDRISNVFIRCATILGNAKSLQVITVDEDPSDITPIEEILEIFVRVNSGGLVLMKSDLLMSLLDLKWNDIQPELLELVREINESRPYGFTRDDVLKSLLLAEGAETRFDRLVSDRKKVESLAEKLPLHIEDIKHAWQILGCILLDDCKISSERFFRGGHNSLLPFVLFLAKNKNISNEERRRISLGIYISIMSGIFSGAEARMGSFSKKIVANSNKFPINELCNLVQRQYGISSFDELLKRHLDLALNITHGGITLDKNPEELQRDHIFPKSTLEAEGRPWEEINHYANFHFLRAVDNLNKTNKPPHEWFKKPSKKNPPYTDQDLSERLLKWEDLQPGNYDNMIKARSERIIKRAETILGYTVSEINSLFN